ncbi:MAG: 6-phosphofructokinase [Verrucomicrobia bacterium]|nr:6-phosphofructokinase [Verrucomicrobiota bacterium]
MADLVGNCIVAQSGGPTAVINASVAGVIEEAYKHEQIEEVYGALNGILGVLNEQIMDLSEEKNSTIKGLLYTPAAALGSCRHKLAFGSKDAAKAAEAQRDCERVLEVFKAHNIRYFFYVGGNDSMDTADKVNKLAQAQGYELRVVGVPKTIDNDLPFTDHCPGYGSVIKYLSTAVMEASRDTEAMCSNPTCNLIEVMGRHAGWIAAGTVLAKRSEEDGPHIILLPEVPFTQETFVAEVKEVVARHNRCVIVVGEGLHGPDGKLISFMDGKFVKDAFGHTQLGGAAESIRSIIEKEAGVKCRTAKLGVIQRSASHSASKTDRDNAYMAGARAVQLAVEGQTDVMVTFTREGSGDGVKFGTGTAPLAEIANNEKLLPRDWINERGTLPNEKFIEYARPLIQGEVTSPMEGGLPKYVRLEKHLVEKKCGEYGAK